MRITLRPETDLTTYIPGKKALFLGIRSMRGRPDLPLLLRLMAIHELAPETRANPGPSGPLFYVPPQILALMEEYRRDSRQCDRLGMAHEDFGPFYDAVFPVRIRKRRLLLNNIRRSFDPFVLGEQVLNREMGGRQRFPHERFPLLCACAMILTHYRTPGRYREFLSDWRDTLERGRTSFNEEDFLAVGWEFHQKWKRLFDRSKDSGRVSSGGGPSSSQASSGTSGFDGRGSGGFVNPVPPSPGFSGPEPGEEPPPDTTHGFGSGGVSFTGKRRPGSTGEALGASEEMVSLPGIHGELPLFHPASQPREVFPWDQGLILSETKSLARFLKVGKEELSVAGLTGRLLPQKISQPTLKLMSRPGPFRGGGYELRILAIVDYSFSMDGWAHYYASHLVQVIARSRIASTLDVIASSSRFQFRMNPDHLNLLQPDEMEGFQNLVPLIDRSGGRYDVAVVLTDCQISDRSAQALGELRKKVRTVGCFVVPEEVLHVRGRPIEMVIADGREIFPSSFLYANTFHGLGLRLALTLNRMRHRRVS